MTSTQAGNQEDAGSGEPGAGSPPRPGTPAPAGPDSPVQPAAAPAAETPARWRPWQGRPRARDLICAAGLVLSGVWALAMIPLTPVLIATRPVLLELLAGSTTSIVAAGSFSDVSSKLQIGVVVAAALPGLMKFDLFYWWAGVLWGRRGTDWFGARGGRWAAAIGVAERRGSRYAVPAVIVAAFLPGTPTPLIYAAAGWVGLGPVAFVLSDVLGSTIWAIMLAIFGHQLGASGVAAANLVSRYALFATLVLLVVFAIPHGWHLIRARRARARLRARPDASGQLPS